MASVSGMPMTKGEYILRMAIYKIQKLKKILIKCCCCVEIDEE